MSWDVNSRASKSGHSEKKCNDYFSSTGVLRYTVHYIHTCTMYQSSLCMQQRHSVTVTRLSMEDIEDCANLHRAACARGEHHYIDPPTGFLVFTEGETSSSYMYHLFKALCHLTCKTGASETLGPSVSSAARLLLRKRVPTLPL